jgi:hypothetical protein
MADIRYVCLSDMHFGAETSLLTNLHTASSELDPSQPSPVLQHLVECLRFLIAQNAHADPKPTLVLNGDILEFALAGDHQALMTFQRFLDLIMPPGEALFGRIIYNPGNHDHHFWEVARETQYFDKYLATVSWDQEIKPPWHTTNIFSKTVPSYSLNRLIRRLPHLQDAGVETIIETAYPNFGVLSEDRQKCVIIHHGHFIESMYTLLTTLMTLLFPDRPMPVNIWDLEEENFAWIDFFWSALGRSGEAGKGVGAVYEKLQKREKVKQLLGNLARGLAQKYDLPGWGDRMEAKMLEWAFEKVAEHVQNLERNKPERTLSEDAEKGLWAYVEGPLRAQILGECANRMPLDVTFIFGHTHKPFEQDLNFAGYPRWVNVYNTGGWVVDKEERQPLCGAAVVLMDESLNATSLRLYNEAEREADYRVLVREARHPGDQPSAFHVHIESLVRQAPSPWERFSAAAARAVNVRAQNLRARIRSQRP